MKRFAYLDRAGILHLVRKEDTAKQYSKNGKYKEVEMDVTQDGYPVAEYEGERHSLVCYEKEGIYVKGNLRDGIKVPEGTYPEIEALIKCLK